MIHYQWSQTQDQIRRCPHLLPASEIANILPLVATACRSTLSLLAAACANSLSVFSSLRVYALSDRSMFLALLVAVLGLVTPSLDLVGPSFDPRCGRNLTKE